VPAFGIRHRLPLTCVDGEPMIGLHATMTEMEAALESIRQSPGDAGVLEMIVRRPSTDVREVLEEAALDIEAGLVGDYWGADVGGRGRAPDVDTQLTVMNARVIALLARERSRWPLAGDQLYVDFDLSADNVPPGTRLALGAAIIEVTAEPHTGCSKFAARFGRDATRFVNSPAGRQLQLRGINARVVRAGQIRASDIVSKV
jgi:MOSC domain-containing protein YiiM